MTPEPQESIATPSEKKVSIGFLVMVLVLCLPTPASIAIAGMSFQHKGSPAWFFAGAIRLISLFFAIPLAALVALIASFQRQKDAAQIAVMWIAIALSLALLLSVNVYNPWVG